MKKTNVVASIIVLIIIVVFLYLRFQMNRESDEVELCKLYLKNKKDTYFKIYYDVEFGIRNDNVTPLYYEFYRNNKLIGSKVYFAGIDGDLKKEQLKIDYCNGYHFVTFFNEIKIICDSNYVNIKPNNYSKNSYNLLMAAEKAIQKCPRLP